MLKDGTSSLKKPHSYFSLRVYGISKKNSISHKGTLIAFGGCVGVVCGSGTAARRPCTYYQGRRRGLLALNGGMMLGINLWITKPWPCAVRGLGPGEVSLSRN